MGVVRARFPIPHKVGQKFRSVDPLRADLVKSRVGSRDGPLPISHRASLGVFQGRLNCDAWVEESKSPWELVAGVDDSRGLYIDIYSNRVGLGKRCLLPCEVGEIYLHPYWPSIAAIQNGCPCYSLANILQPSLCSAKGLHRWMQVGRMEISNMVVPCAQGAERRHGQLAGFPSRAHMAPGELVRIHVMLHRGQLATCRDTARCINWPATARDHKGPPPPRPRCPRLGPTGVPPPFRTCPNSPIPPRPRAPLTRPSPNPPPTGHLARPSLPRRTPSGASGAAPQPVTRAGGRTPAPHGQGVRCSRGGCWTLRQHRVTAAPPRGPCSGPTPAVPLAPLPPQQPSPQPGQARFAST